MDVLCVTRHQREYFLALFKYQRRRCDGRVTVNAPTLQGCRYLSAGNFSHNHSIFEYRTVHAVNMSCQHALKCDGCDKWQHRKCKAGDTGITLQEYRVMVRTDETFAWYCAQCLELIVLSLYYYCFIIAFSLYFHCIIVVDQGSR